MPIVVTIRSVLGVFPFEADHSTVGDARQAFLDWAHGLNTRRHDRDRIRGLAQDNIDRIEIESEQLFFGVVPDNTLFDSDDFKEYVLQNLNGDMDIVPVRGLRAVVHLKRGALPCTGCMEPLCAEHDQTDVRVFDGFIIDAARGFVSNYLPEMAGSVFCAMLNAATEGETDALEKLRSLINSYAAAVDNGDAPVLHRATERIRRFRAEKRAKTPTPRNGPILDSVRDRGADNHDFYIAQRFMFSISLRTRRDLGLAMVDPVELQGWPTTVDASLEVIMEYVNDHADLAVRLNLHHAAPV